MDSAKNSSDQMANIVEYLVCCIGAFAQQYQLTNEAAYRYLDNHKGLEFIEKYYETEHTFSIEDAVKDMTQICRNHGGNI